MASNGAHKGQSSPLEPFALERFFAKHEFTAKYLACCSDVESLTLAELLSMADSDSLSRWDNLALGYTETAGLPALRQEIAQMYKALKPDNIVVLAPEEGVYLAMRALLTAGDHVVCVFPGYQSLYAIAQSIGCSVSLWEPVAGAGGALTFELDTFKSLLRPTTRLAIVNFPHNPTGFLPSKADWVELLHAVSRVGCHLFSDEMYRLMELNPDEHRLPAAADAYGKGISLSGMSKAFALPGLRIGWLASQDKDFLAKVLELKDYTTICPPAPSEVLALMALRAQTQILERSMDIIRANIHIVEVFMDDFAELFEWTPPRAGSVAFPRLKVEESIETFCELLIGVTGVALLPATVYSHKPSIDARHFRLGLGRKNLPECLNQIARPLRKAMRAQHDADDSGDADGSSNGSSSSRYSQCVIS